MDPDILKRFHITGCWAARQIMTTGTMKASSKGLLGPGVYCGPIETVALHSIVTSVSLRLFHTPRLYPEAPGAKIVASSFATRKGPFRLSVLESTCELLQHRNTEDLDSINLTR